MRWLLASGVSLALAACGGGGGGDGGGTTPPPTPPAQTNTAPSAQAGADQTIQLPTNSVSLSGSATDAENNPITYSWSATPAGVTFANASAAATTATFPGAGTYTLTLTASDGTLSGTDTVAVTVQAAAATNAAPTVDAGTDRTIELPASVRLQPTVTDDGNPTPAALTYAWTVTSGTGVTFESASTASTSARFTTAGTYTLQLAVSDGALTTTDTVQVIVNPAVYPAADTDAASDPLHGWATITPADAGMNPARLAEAQAYATSSSPLTSSGMIIKGGRVVHYWGNLDQRYDVKSTAKSIGGIALGLAFNDGRITDITARAHAYLPTVGTQPPPPPQGANWPGEITLLQLATHTAGFEKDDSDSPLQSQPGTQWFYSDASLNWLSDVLTQIYGEDLKGLLTTRIFSRLGIQTPAVPTADSDDYIWTGTTDDRSSTLGGITRRPFHSGIRMNAHSLGRIGLLFLRNGVWANDERLLPESFITMVQTPRSEVSGTGNVQSQDFPSATTDYGVLWWTNETGTLQGVPRDAYWAWGLGDSLIVVIPSLDLVVVRAGDQAAGPDSNPNQRTWNDFDWNGDYSVLAPFLVPIVQSLTP